jgi:hypothetical protein
MAEKGQEERFLPSTPNDRCRFSKPTFAGECGNG